MSEIEIDQLLEQSDASTRDAAPYPSIPTWVKLHVEDSEGIKVTWQNIFNREDYNYEWQVPEGLIYQITDIGDQLYLTRGCTPGTYTINLVITGKTTTYNSGTMSCQVEVTADPFLTANSPVYEGNETTVQLHGANSSDYDILWSTDVWLEKRINGTSLAVSTYWPERYTVDCTVSNVNTGYRKTLSTSVEFLKNPYDRSRLQVIVENNSKYPYEIHIMGESMNNWTQYVSAGESRYYTTPMRGKNCTISIYCTRFSPWLDDDRYFEINNSLDGGNITFEVDDQGIYGIQYRDEEGAARDYVWFRDRN